MIEGERIYLRAIEPEDEEACWRWVNDPEVTRFLLLGPWPVSRAAEKEWVQSRARGTDEAHRVVAICLKENGRHVGNAGLHGIQMRHGTATLGIMIGEKDCWDRGYGEEAVRLMLRLAFRDLGLRKIRLSVFTPNLRALRCYEKCGFEVEGILRRQQLIDGQYVDEILMAVFRPNKEESGGAAPGSGVSCTP